MKQEKEKGKKQTNQSFTALSHIRKDPGLHLTDGPIYVNSLQVRFETQTISV